MDLFPAWAGVILLAVGKEARRNAFPRMGGGDPGDAFDHSNRRIFSPHGRG